MVVWDSNGQKHLVKSVWSRRVIKVQGTLPPAFALTLLELSWDATSQTAWVDDSSVVLPHRISRVDSLTGVTELCAGLGGVLTGLEKAGCSIKINNDLRETFTTFLNRDRSQHTGCEDIDSPATSSKIHAWSPDSSILTAGFNCQPWRKRGDQRRLKLSTRVVESGIDPQVTALIKKIFFSTRCFEIDEQAIIGVTEANTTLAVPLAFVEAEPAPVVFPSASGSFARDIYTWFWRTFHPLEGTAVWVSSRQLLLIYHQITGRFGCYRTKSDGRWHQFQQTNLDTFDFCNAATDCSPFARAIVKLSARQRRPSGVADWRWLHLDIPIALIYAVDRLLERHRVSPTLFVPKAFRGFRVAFHCHCVSAEEGKRS